VLGLDVVPCSGCTGESSGASSPALLPVMTEVRPVCVGQRAFHCGRHDGRLIGPVAADGSFFQQQPALLEGGRPGTSRGLSPSDSSQGGESGSVGGVA